MANSDAQNDNKTASTIDTTGHAKIRPPARKGQLLRSGAITAGATLLSRILGMVRDIAIASLLGAGLASDVFFFANRIPNFFRRLFAEGAFAQAFVPVLSSCREQKDSAALKSLIAATAGTLGLIVLAVCIIGMLASPLLTALFGFGWFQAWLDDATDAHKFTEASFLLQLTFPYLFFITLTALCCSHPNMVLAVAMTAGGVAQLIFVLPAVYRLRLLVLPRFAWHHAGVKRIRNLMIPGLIGVSASQINLLVNTVLATFLATGSISYLYYSDRLLEFPIGIFAVAISTVILPALARVKARGDQASYVKTLDWGVRMVLLLGIPSALGIAALREPILRVIFMRGAFTDGHVLLSAASLAASLSGLCAIMLVRVLVQGFAALQDTKTPVRCAITAMLANIIFNLILVWPLGYVGLALSTALAAYVNAGQLVYLLFKRKIYSPSRHTLIFCSKALIAGVVMFAAVRHLSPDFTQWASWDTLTACAYLALYVATGAVIFTLCSLILGIRPRELKA